MSEGQHLAGRVGRAILPPHLGIDGSRGSWGVIRGLLIHQECGSRGV